MSCFLLTVGRYHLKCHRRFRKHSAAPETLSHSSAIIYTSIDVSILVSDEDSDSMLIAHCLVEQDGDQYAIIASMLESHAGKADCMMTAIISQGSQPFIAFILNGEEPKTFHRCPENTSSITLRSLRSHILQQVVICDYIALFGNQNRHPCSSDRFTDDCRRMTRMRIIYPIPRKIVL